MEGRIVHRLFFILLVLLLSRNGICQNLISNASFEDTIACPSSISGACPGFYDALINTIPPWHLPTCGSADYLNSCANAANWVVGVPTNALGYQPARTGEAYAGMVVFADYAEYREYIARPLDTPLVAGKTYYAEMYVSAVDNFGGSCPTDRIGMYFSTGVPDTTGVYWGVLAVSPQIENPSGNILTDTVNWMKVSGSFIASGGENYVTIGNFKPDISVQGCLTDQSYYYIDDVLLMEDTAASVNEEKGIKNREIRIYPNPAKDEFIVKGNFGLPAVLELYNIVGKKVRSETVRKENEQIDVSDLARGMYVVKLMSNEGAFTKKLLFE